VEVPLTEREAQVLRHMAGGLTNKQIADALGISYETVKEHVQHILGKMASPTERRQQCGSAQGTGLVKPPPPLSPRFFNRSAPHDSTGVCRILGPRFCGLEGTVGVVSAPRSGRF